MRRRIILGRYLEGDSSIHRLDPRAKIVSMVLFMLVLFQAKSYMQVIILFIFALFVMTRSRLPLTYFVRAVKPLIFLLLFVFLMHLVLDTGGVELFQVGKFALYSGGLEKGVVSASRMALFIAFAALLTFTTQSEQLARGLGRVLQPLQHIGVPIDKLTVMLGIALRFIPTVFEEAERVWKAQVSRGLDLRMHPLRERARLIIALLVPVTTSTFRRALRLADSMEARNYRLGARRTTYRKMVWQTIDTVYLATFILPLVVVRFIS